MCTQLVLGAYKTLATEILLRYERDETSEMVAHGSWLRESWLTASDKSVSLWTLRVYIAIDPAERQHREDRNRREPWNESGSLSWREVVFSLT